ncbi:carbohydrate ABC transporter permease [Alicyclobacillus fastidiosus]|uniref:Sugar ABC transporter permease n=1 Tax=Alicyclobacillus fastidiosus TaxID=392011 RepID=A0ABV5AJE2_9BACL|nr:sugar ABC transporter permease [Alicyclobacillus fastidiosus]WEH08352.1 sugar ABC transporter permease [Alicyclobacillus fastidiosus]
MSIGENKQRSLYSYVVPSTPIKKEKKQFSAYAFIAPTTILFAIFYFYPLIMSIIDGFRNVNLMGGTGTFAGLHNYKMIFSNGDFLNAFKNTSIYTIAIVLFGTFIPMVVAVLLNLNIKGKSIYRTLFFLPMVAPSVASAMVFSVLFENDKTGTINEILSFFHVKPINWLGQASGILPMIAVIIFGIWALIGYNMLLFLAGLQNISSEYYEAAKLDGASGWSSFWKITFPLLSPTTLFVVVVTVIGGFQVFDQIYMLTAGGPMNDTTTMVYYIYQSTFVNQNPGLACAMATILFIILLIFSILQINISGRNKVEV